MKKILKYRQIPCGGMMGELSFCGKLPYEKVLCYYLSGGNLTERVNKSIIHELELNVSSIY
jgi:hypothetical protein